MRLRPLLFFAGALALSGSSLAHADFDPKGKKKKPPVVVPGPGPGPGKNPGKDPDEHPTAKKDPIKKAAIIAMARPGESGPILKLAQLYRERDGSLDKGIAEWKRRAEGYIPDAATEAKIAELEAKAKKIEDDPKSTPTDKAEAQKYREEAKNLVKPTASADDKWAARMAYAGLLKSDKRDAMALAEYETCAKDKADKPVVQLAIARLKQDAGDLKGAYAAYEKALPLEKDKLEREATLRSMMELAVDQKDHAAAKKHHNDLVAQNKDSMTVRAELARTYFKKNQYELAEKEYEEVAKAAAGDNRVYASALLDLGVCQVKLQKYETAVATLKKGLGVAGAEAGAKVRLLNALAEAYRAQNKIEELVADLEKQNPADADRQELIGKLAAEYDAEKGIKWLGKALASAPQRTDARILLIRLLKEQSKLDEAVKQYDLLIQHAKGQPQFTFELCDLLIGRGERPKCLAKLKTMESAAATDPEIQQRLASYYSQIGEDKLALALMESLAKKSGDDPSYIVDLGDYWYQRGNTAKAKEIWKRLTVIVKPKAKGFTALGEVYLDHDMGEDALDAYKQAIDAAPGELAVQKGYAAALERNHKYIEAQGVWETILKRNDVDKLTRREARTHLVLLWLAQKKLPDQIKPLSSAFAGPPVDLEAGRLLAEVQLHLRKLPDAEKTLRAIIEQAPGDVDARLVLERVLVQQGHVADAMKILEELVKADPKGARGYYTRLASYALSIYKDEEALKWAAAAVELSPEDADGHKKLGEMYRSQQDFPRAIKEFRLALQHNPKLWPVYFELAELLLAQGDEVDADVLYRRVMRGSTDDELVANAIRFSAAINQKRGTLEVLETELLPLTLGNPQKVVYRRLLVEVYSNLTAPLIAKVKNGGEGADAARVKLQKIGQRGVQPLIDALSDTDANQQRTAIEILAYVENKSAGTPLFAFATQASGSPVVSPGSPLAPPTTDPALRARAMIACGALRDPALLPKYEAYLFPKTGPIPKDAVAQAAAFGLARMDDKKAIPLALRLVEAIEAVPSEMRIYGVIALGKSKDKAHAPSLEAFLKKGEGGNYGRAAALWALAEIGEASSLTAITGQIEAFDPTVRAFALLAVARYGAPAGKGKKPVAEPNEATIGVLAAATLDPAERVRKAAGLAFATLATKDHRPVLEPLPVPEGPINAEAAVLPLLPARFTHAELGQALVAYEKPLTNAVVTALQTSKDRGLVALDLMLAQPTGASFGAFTLEKGDAGKDARAAAERIALAAEPFVARLVHHPEIGVETRAVRWLGRRDGKIVREALGDALDSPNAEVQRLAIAELAVRGDATNVAGLATVLSTHKEWSVRADAARALGQIGKRDATAAVEPALLKAAKGDKFAFVREAALRGLAASGRPSAKAALVEAQAGDPEPRVREVAKTLLAAPSPP